MYKMLCVGSIREKEGDASLVFLKGFQILLCKGSHSIVLQVIHFLKLLRRKAEELLRFQYQYSHIICSQIFALQCTSYCKFLIFI